MDRVESLLKLFKSLNRKEIKELSKRIIEKIKEKYGIWSVKRNG